MAVTLFSQEKFCFPGRNYEGNQINHFGIMSMALIYAVTHTWLFLYRGRGGRKGGDGHTDY